MQQNAPMVKTCCNLLHLAGLVFGIQPGFCCNKAGMNGFTAQCNRIHPCNLLLLLLFNGLLKNYSNRRQRQNYRNSNNIKSTVYTNKNKIDIKTITQKKDIFINNKSYKLIREII